MAKMKTGFDNNDVERVNLKAFKTISFKVIEKFISIPGIIFATRKKINR